MMSDAAIGRKGADAAPGCRLLRAIRCVSPVQGMTNFAFFSAAPAGTLEPYVQRFWEVSGDFDFARDRMLPTHLPALVFNLGSPQSLISDSGSTQLAGAWVCGPQLAPQTTVSPPGSWVCGVRLTHMGAFLSLGVSPRSLAGRIVDLSDLWGSAAEALFQRVCAAANHRHRFELLGETILERVGAGRQWNSEVAHSATLIRKARGNCSIRALSEEAGWSRQKLHRTFIDCIGIAPKTMARLERFNHAVDLMGFRPDVNLADVAYAAGYFDQAHFTREFCEFSGLTPGQYLRARTPDPIKGFH